MAFSSGVKLGDLDDFIGLSQECVKPLIEAADGASAKLFSVSEAKAVPVAEVPLVQRPNLIKSKQSGADPKAQIGQVTLSDCLACSGCVTSAETVLLQEQSGEEFLKRTSSSALTVVSISAEARTSLASSSGESPLLAMQRAAEGLRQLGVSYVLDCSAAEALALLEGKAEFVNRFRNASSGGSSSSKSKAHVQASNGGALPLLTSHCPGWTLYAEKVVDPVVLPHLAPLRPPQQVQGRLVKTCLLESHNRRRFHRWWRARSPLFASQHLLIRPLVEALAPGPKPLGPADVYHVSVQPCYDRKIEAARPSFEVPGEDGVKEVDTVLTATELRDLVLGTSTGCCGSEEACQASGLQDLIACPLDSQVLTDVFLGSLEAPGRPQPLICAVRGNAGSGGFMEHVFRESARELFQIDLPASALEFKTKQNEDMRELTLTNPQTQKILLRFTAAYGFRNIQNVIRRVSKASLGSDSPHFVEIMACPGGCLNGSGLIPDDRQKAESSNQTARRQRLDGLEDILVNSPGTAQVAPADHPLVLPLYRYILSRSAEAGSKTVDAASLESMVGSKAARAFLFAEWRSLKVDSEGKDVVGTSALKW
mmetsp:Transcript_28573/g.51769  ORF Transcript_28573/g.51769 Transcript_28573/m.51769 type:complete len:595 (+) Transcript_28573:34-1818(+)